MTYNERVVRAYDPLDARRRLRQHLRKFKIRGAKVVSSWEAHVIG